MDSKRQFGRASRKVRVVARIRGFSGPEADSEPGASRTMDWVSVNRESTEDVTISFGDQSSSRYLVDYCYKEDEDNELIYSREVKPLVTAAFEGRNSTVIAHGARGSGKTHVIQGSAERPGLAVLAVAEFLSMAEKNGKSIAVSFYEVDFQERAMDLLNPEKPPILVLEDHGRIQFKGLSQVPVKSIAEFQNLYSSACFALKGAPKKGGCERDHRSHMGLTVYVFSQNEVSKVNFVDMAGYEDARKKSSDGSCLAEINKTNKSIYALLNVCHALSTNESRVAYRESKITRMLQDSLRGTCKILLVSCLNPSFCQDTIYMVSLASRSCRIIQASLDSTKKIASSAKQMVKSHKNQIHESVSGTAKKLHGSSKLLDKKVVVAKKSAMKGRKLFDEASHPTTKKTEKEISVAHVTQALKDNSLSETGNDVVLNSRVEKQTGNDVVLNSEVEKQPGNDFVLNSVVEKQVGNHVVLNSEVEQDDSFSKASEDLKLHLVVQNDDSSLNANTEVELNPLADQGISVDGDDNQKEHTPYASNYSEALSNIVQEDQSSMNKENNDSSAIGDNGLLAISSPPISSQLRDLSNSLKMLCSSTPSNMQILEKEPVPLDIVETKTPTTEQNKSVNRWDAMNAKSPWETFSMRGSGMKSSLVQEYLRFLNTANKEELKKLKGIGEKRATYILELREESPEPFKSLDDLKDVGLSAKQIKGIMKKEVGELFS